MARFSCVTCSESLEEPEMLKHLSATRHKSITYEPSQETLECEQCHDTNIHQMTIVRYGGQDMSMLCQLCLNKEKDKPSTLYTLQNGSILKNLENYFKVRDLTCIYCDNDSHLYVNKNRGSDVVCFKCLKEKNLHVDSYVSENDDNFLYILLGIKEHVKPSATSKKFDRKRKAGRGKKSRFGKNGKGDRPSRGNGGSGGKPETLRSFKALDKREVNKLKPEDEKGLKLDKPKPSNVKTKANGGTKELNKASPSKGSSAKGTASKGNGNERKPFKEETKKGQNQKQSKKQLAKGKNTTHGSSKMTNLGENQQLRSTYESRSQPQTPVQNQNVGPQVSGRQPLPQQSEYFAQSQLNLIPSSQSQFYQNGNYHQRGQSYQLGQYQIGQQVYNPRFQNQGASDFNKSYASSPAVTTMESLPEQAANVTTKKDQKKPDSKRTDTKREKKKIDGNKETNSSEKIDVLRKNMKNMKISSPSSKPSKPSKKEAKHTKDSTSAKSGKLNKDKTNSKANKGKDGTETPRSESTSVAEVKIDKNFLKSIPADLEHEEFEHIPKYLANQPQLSYDTLNQYFKEMCYHLYLEEKLETKPIVDFTAEYSQDNRRLFKVVIPYTEEIEKMVPEKFRKLGKLPFTINQAVFVSRSSDKDNIWECFVKDFNLVTYRGKKIEVLLELYKWNDTEKFPVGSMALSLLPSSATISRILFAMGRIENPKFIKMLLGKEPIRQINFKNYLNFTKDTFNDSQKGAIQHVLNNSITVLQGPPGTGKTSTIYEIILQLLRNLRTFPILVVAASNIAIDNIAEKLKNDKDLNILRIVSNEKNREYNEHHHLSDICLHHKVFDMLPQRNKETFLDLRYGRPVSKNGYKKMLTVSNSITDKLISQAQVILTTTVVAGGFQLKSIKKLPVVIMDESTQSSEAATLIPLSMPGVDKFIFVGDDKQLSSFSDIPYLEQSLFERVLKNGTYTQPHMLNVQYRMNPAISAFPIKNFYKGMLSDGVTGEQRAIEGVEPLVFVDHKGDFKESKVSNFRRGGSGGYTYTNKGECDLILRILKHFILEKGIKRENISVITPYSAQRDLVATSIQQDIVINPEGKAIEEEVDEDSLTSKKPTTIKTIVDIMVSSIDAFQGREKDVIIFSCVRSNEENNIGFVKDARRLNVALTRARCGLILVGDGSTMSQGDPLWKNLMGHLEENKMVTDVESYFS